MKNDNEDMSKWYVKRLVTLVRLILKWNHE